MVFYAYEKIKNERAKFRRQGADLALAKFLENPDLSPEELRKVVMADLEEAERIRNQNRR